MTIQPHEANQPSARQESQAKKPYATPVLRQFGKMHNRTLGSTGGKRESGRVNTRRA